ncbi:MAG: bifunctional (p)ppGpp synthetase/guanosine-3',5'-bis(diphosphate) 3'-pyrophosphohydrolase [Candidatus Sumerlaeaceae bacterium]|nr:bifunctional (p)ppGpp synthetase/guanosine-3',5'-bis(diphosphate) 3'-pyrophosphohydrolase [Candidatus Sumerlaeaceae bacterium]
MTTLTADTIEAEPVLRYILGDSRDKYAESDKALMRHAYEFAREAHKNQKRASGDPYISHCVEVARILAERIIDANSVAAALLHDVIEDCHVDHETLAEEFNPTVADLVEGVTKISSLHFGSQKEQQAENLRKMILAMTKDIRVIIIKLADRLHNMRTLQHLATEKQVKIARDTMMVYAPLANRLGMTRVKSELEDASMSYLHPEEYRDIAQRIAMKKAERDTIVQKSIERLGRELQQQGIKAEITGRSKHLYSVYMKMTRQDIPFQEIHDLIGLRVLCDTVPACYEILGTVHKIWRPIHGRFKDYIALPKENMYQSLHTTVVGPRGERIEIQVRTYEMHKFAEEGIAAHWKYKEGIRGKDNLEEKLVWLRRLTEWLNDVRDPGEFMDALQKDVFSDTVFCFTPAGDVIELPAGSTPLDFAYTIHSKLGETCTGAKVNHRMIPLRTTLHNGDFVEIITSKSGHPSADWLDIVKTSRARTKIKHWLKTKNFQENVERGRELLAKGLRARGLQLDWAVAEATITPHLKAFKLTTFDELLGEVGFGGLLAQQVLQRAYPEAPPADKPQPKKGARVIRKQRKSQGVIVEGLPNTVLRYAGCCAPVPGDKIVGFVTVGRGVAIHQQDCPSLNNIIQEIDAAARLVKAEWDVQHSPMRRVTIRVECQDRQGLLADITGAINSMNVFIVESSTKSKADTATLKFIVEIKSIEQLNNLFNNLRKIKGVVNLSRISRAEIA